MKEIARLLILSGGVLFLAGVLLYILGRLTGLGRLPGDIFFKNGNFSFYFPITTCLAVSLFLTLLFNFFRRGNP